MKATTPLPRGVVEADLGGQKRTFKFGMNTLAAFSELHAGRPDDFGEQFTRNPVGAMRDMAYCGLLARQADNQLPADFSPETVGDWIDEMPQVDWNRVQAVMLGALALGKPTPATDPPA